MTPFRPIWILKGATISIAINQHNKLTIRLTTSNICNSCNNKQDCSSIRTCCKRLVLLKCRINWMRITYLPFKSSNLTRCQVLARQVNIANWSMRRDYLPMKMQVLKHMNTKRTKMTLLTDRRQPFIKCKLHSLKFTFNNSSIKGLLKMTCKKSRGDSRRSSITIHHLETDLMSRIWNPQSFTKWCLMPWS